MSIFGPILTKRQIEEAVQATLKDWTPLYIRQVEREIGGEDNVGKRPEFQTFIIADTEDKFPEDGLPLCMIVSSGIDDGSVKKDGEGTIRAKWRVGLAAVASGNTREESDELASTYGAALRSLMLHRQSLDQAFDNRVRGTELVSEGYADLPGDAERTLSAVRVIFLVEVDGISQVNRGPITPAEPPEDPTVPPEDWPRATSANAVIVKEQI